MCILAGFPQTPNKTATVTAFPFGIWFADARTLYVADEGDGYTGGTDLYTHAAAQTTAGLQKWVFNSATGTWALAYTLTNGLGLGQAYDVRGYPSGSNPGTGLPWAPATDGLRNITGQVGRDGVATIWAITSTISGNGDTGADPNRLVAIRDAVQISMPASRRRRNFFTLAYRGFCRSAPRSLVYAGHRFAIARSQPLANCDGHVADVLIAKDDCCIREPSPQLRRCIM